MKRAPDVPRAGKEVVLEAIKLSNPEARLMVADYYAAQEMRKRSDMHVRHLGDKKEVSIALQYTADGYAVIENNVKKMLQKYAAAKPVGEWAMSHVGIGPVIAAGCLAHLDIEKAPTAGHFHSFAGLNPNAKWLKGQKRPWNADLKQIMWHLGQSAKKQSGREDAFYGQLYRERKDLLEKRNEEGFYSERAKVFVTKSAEWKKVLTEGRLPAGNIDQQACNFVAKIFLSHLHAVMFWEHFNQPPPKPYSMAILGHAHEIKIPNLHMWPGLEQAYYYGKRAEAAE